MPTGTADATDRQTLTIAEAAAALGIGLNNAYQAAREGRIPTIRGMGRRLIVPRAAFERLLAGE